VIEASHQKGGGPSRLAASCRVVEYGEFWRARGDPDYVNFRAR